MPKYPGISPYDNEKGTLGTAKKRWEKIFVKEIESDTISGMNAEIENLATTAENSVANAVAAKNAAESAQTAAENAAETAATAAAGIQSVAETDVDNTLTIPGVAADAKVTGDWLRDIAKPVTLDTAMPATAYADEYMKVTTDSEGRVLYGVKRDGTFTWKKGVPRHVIEACNPTMDNPEWLYLIKDLDDKVLFGIKRDGTVSWPKGIPQHVIEACNPTMDNPEFLQVIQDANGNLIEGITATGVKEIFTPIRFEGGVHFKQNDAQEIKRILEDTGTEFGFDYTNYLKTPVGEGFSYTSGLNVLYLDGDMTGISKDNKVNLTYRYNGQLGTCTCKWQGASSIRFPKKNYTIAKLTPAIDVGWGAQKKYCLKADYPDFSHARNLVSAKLWGQMVKSRATRNTKLYPLPNGGAVDGFPIMLVINGEYQGLYNFNIPKDPWMLDMGEGNYEAMITAETSSPTTSFKATVTEEELLEKLYWEIEYIPDENNYTWALNSFNQMLSAVINSTGVNYRDTVDSYLDMDSALDYYIHCCALGNADGNNHNFIMSTYDGVKWFFTAYDMDWTFGAGNFSTRWYSPEQSNTFAYAQEQNRVMHLLYRYDKDVLKNRYTDLRNSVLSESNIMTVVYNYFADIPKAVFDEEMKLWPTTPGTTVATCEQLINWFQTHVKYMDKEIDNL